MKNYRSKRAAAYEISHISAPPTESLSHRLHGFYSLHPDSSPMPTMPTTLAYPKMPAEAVKRTPEDSADSASVMDARLRKGNNPIKEMQCCLHPAHKKEVTRLCT